MQIDRLSLEGYTNLDSWVRMVDDQVVAVLLQRLRSIIDLWGTQITQTPDEIATAHKVRATNHSAEHNAHDATVFEGPEAT